MGLGLNLFSFNERGFPLGYTVGGKFIRYDYDKDSLLELAGALDIVRDPEDGSISEIKLGPVNEAFDYTEYGEIKNQNSSLYSVSYERGTSGRIDVKTETVEGIARRYEYYYDDADRLWIVKVDGRVVSEYTYDENGNRTSHNGLIATYDEQDRLEAYGKYFYTYKPNGELESKTNKETNETTEYSYDVFGNLRQVRFANGAQIEYLIDGQNRRVGKKVNGRLTQGLLYIDQLKPVAEVDASGKIRSIFVYGSKNNIPDYMIKDGIDYRLFSDQLGSVRLVVRTTDQVVVQRIDYDEFGRVTSDSNPGFQPFGFAGGIYDQHTGLVRFGARDYDPMTGRWTSKDPILFAGGDANLYGYVLQDPINLIDPSGNCPWCIGAVVGGVASGASAYLAGGDAQTIAVSSAIGAAAGAASMGVSMFATSASAVVGANVTIGAGANIVTQLATGTSAENVNYSSIGISAFAGGVGAAAGLGAGTAAFYRTPVVGRTLGVATARRNELLTSTLIGTTLGTGIEAAGTCH